MNDHTGRGFDGQRKRTNDRVGDRDKLDIERADLYLVSGVYSF